MEEQGTDSEATTALGCYTGWCHLQCTLTSHFICTVILSGGIHYPHFTDKATKRR